MTLTRRYGIRQRHIGWRRQEAFSQCEPRQEQERGQYGEQRAWRTRTRSGHNRSRRGVRAADRVDGRSQRLRRPRRWGSRVSNGEVGRRDSSHAALGHGRRGDVSRERGLSNRSRPHPSRDLCRPHGGHPCPMTVTRGARAGPVANLGMDRSLIRDGRGNRLGRCAAGGTQRVGQSLNACR